MKYSQVATVIAIAMMSDGTHANGSGRGVRGLMADDATDAIVDQKHSSRSQHYPADSIGHLTLAELIALLPPGKYVVLFVYIAMSIYIYTHIYILYFFDLI